MHSPYNSEMTSMEASSPPATPSLVRQPVYYVISPSNNQYHQECSKISFGGDSSHVTSPVHPHHHRYASSPIHYSSQSSTTTLPASWRKLHHHPLNSDDDEYDDVGPATFRCYAAWFLVWFVLLFTAFALALWGASKAYKPHVSVEGLVFHEYDLHAGQDLTGVPTEMLTINSTVRISFRNPATFFGVHASSTPLEIYFSDLKMAAGDMKEFYLSHKSSQVVAVEVSGVQVPVYGGGLSLRSRAEDGGAPAVVPLEMTFTVRARAYVLGHLVKTKFDRDVRCSFYLREDRLGKALDLRKACEYHER